MPHFIVYFSDAPLSNLIRRAPSTKLLARLASVPPRQQCTSSITLGELVYEACRFGEWRQALLEQIESRLLPSLPVYPFDASAARRYGILRTELEERGLPLAEADLRIAAITLVNDFTLISGNVRHFERVPKLRVENWLE